ncbi:MAG: hypothetical protein J5662_01615 [Clostridia bacterium]|nr:hypothetical protein [Clostridia bacterium]
MNTRTVSSVLTEKYYEGENISLNYLWRAEYEEDLDERFDEYLEMIKEYDDGNVEY